jgi:nucleoside-diphosphate-sugar epimerase
VCQKEPVNSIDVNVTGTVNVLEASRLANVRRIIFASSGAVYENNTKFPCVEDDSINPNLIYSMSKSFCEKLCNSCSQLYGMEVCITRYYNVYGPHQDIKRTSPPFVAYLIKELLQNKKPILHYNGEQQRDYVYIDDVNELNLLCMTHPNAKGQIFNVSSGIAISVNQIYKMVATILNSNIKPIFRDSKKLWDKYPSLSDGKYHLNEKRIEEETEKFTLGSVEKAEKLIGWKATTPIEEGLSKTIEYAKKALFK